jgi:hypothetical protein
MEEIGHGGGSSGGNQAPFDKIPALWRLQVQGWAAKLSLLGRRRTRRLA